jgi:hypothetical protein
MYVSRSSYERRNYLKSRRRRIQEASIQAREVEVEDELEAERDSTVRDKDGTWRQEGRLREDET